MRFLDTSRIRVHLDQRMAAGDGTQLSIDLYLPPEQGRYPLLLYRTASDNNRSRTMSSLHMLASAADRWKAYAAQGFILATADVRGRGDSDGTFVPFVHEGEDGAATVDWLRKLPECDGKVGAFGTGYSAFCAWAAIAAGAQVDAVASISPFGSVGEGLFHSGGAVRLDWLFWMHLIGGRTLQPAAVPPWPQVHQHLPMKSMDLALGRSDIQWRTWLAHLDPKDPFWDPVRLAERLARRPVPGLHVTGWWDSQLGGARYYYDAGRRSGAPQSLLIGPWDSAAVRHPAAVVGGLDFGPRSLVDMDETLVQFFGAHLLGEKNAWARPSTRLFVTGRNEWLTTEGWPAGAAGGTRELYLASEGSANTRRGDGVLVERAPSSEAADEVIHNPAVPVEFQPNFRSFAASEFSFSLDQAHITGRDEALVYTSAPFAQTLAISGRPVVILTVCTPAPDADLFVLLSDVFPLGSRDLHLSHAAIRLATLRDFRPGKPLSLTLELSELLHEFLPAHSVRLTVVPSLFPLYARNLHRADYDTATEGTIVSIELHHGPANRGCLRLPLGPLTRAHDDLTQASAPHGTHDSQPVLPENLARISLPVPALG